MSSHPLPKFHKQWALLRPIASTIGVPSNRLTKHLAVLLSPHTGNSGPHIKNSADFVHTLGCLPAGPHNIMGCFNVVSLFTRVPIRNTMSLLSRQFEVILRLFRHVLMAPYFGLPLSPVIANFFMEDFDSDRIQQTLYIFLAIFMRSIRCGALLWKFQGTNTA